MPLYEHIQVKDQSVNSDIDKSSIIDLEYDELVNLLLRDVGQVLLEIYQLYFPHEIRVTQIPDHRDVAFKNSQKSMFEFYKDFEISPGLISKTNAYRIFVEAKELSKTNEE